MQSAKKSTREIAADIEIAGSISSLNSGGVTLIPTVGDQEFNEKVTQAMTNFKEARITKKNVTGRYAKIGTYNHGLALSQSELATLVNTPGFKGVLMCLGLHKYDKPYAPDPNYPDFKLNGIIFPIFRIITADGFADERYVPEVPGFISLNGIYCPPLPQCPPPKT